MKHDKDNDFEVYKSNICHELKHMGDKEFAARLLKNKDIEKMFVEKRYLECFYLLGMLDYLCHLNGWGEPSQYNGLRRIKLDKPVFPKGVFCTAQFSECPDKVFQKALSEAIPEFLKYNIVEAYIRDVC